jgi:hypothetical protein
LKRPVLGTITILVLLCGGLYVGYTLRDGAAGRPVSRAYADSGARSFIEKALRVIVPYEAREVLAAEEGAGGTHAVLARFDLPPREVDSVLRQNETLPQMAELQEDPGSLELIGALANAAKRPWWQPGRLAGARCAQRVGVRRVGSSVVTSTIYVCAGTGEAGDMRVYVALVEQRAGK